MDTFMIIYFTVAFIFLIYLSIKLFLFKYRIIENLIKYDNDIYVKIDRLTFYKIKAKMMKHLSSEKSDEYTATYALMKFIHSTDKTKSAIKKTDDRIINGITVDYINKQIEQIVNKEINIENNQEKISEENKD